MFHKNKIWWVAHHPTKLVHMLRFNHPPLFFLHGILKIPKWKLVRFFNIFFGGTIFLVGNTTKTYKNLHPGGWDLPTKTCWAFRFPTKKSLGENHGRAFRRKSDETEGFHHVCPTPIIMVVSGKCAKKMKGNERKAHIWRHPKYRISMMER